MISLKWLEEERYAVRHRLAVVGGLLFAVLLFLGIYFDWHYPPLIVLAALLAAPKASSDSVLLFGALTAVGLFVLVMSLLVPEPAPAVAYVLVAALLVPAAWWIFWAVMSWPRKVWKGIFWFGFPTGALVLLSMGLLTNQVWLTTCGMVLLVPAAYITYCIRG